MFRLNSKLIIALAFLGLGANGAMAQTADVYVAGYESNANGIFVAKVWKNNALLYNLTDGTGDAIARSIYVSGSDIYVAGDERKANGKRTAKVWKNGEELYAFSDGSQEAFARAVHVSGNDVYTAGEEYYGGTDGKYYVARVWKNNAVLYNLSDGKSAEVSNMYMSDNNNIYVCGSEVHTNGYSRGIVWKNGAAFIITEPTTKNKYAVDITGISDDYLYVSYRESSNKIVYVVLHELYSQNNIDYYYENSNTGATAFIYYDKKGYTGDLYVAVSSPYKVDNKVYKNWEELYSTGESISDISVQDGNVYLATSSAKVWKNGEILYALTDGAKQAEAISIFVVSGGTGLKEVLDNAKAVGYYNIMGQKLDKEPESGVYIIKYDNGTAKKIFKRLETCF
jgi:hypothetical protein